MFRSEPFSLWECKLSFCWLSLETLLRQHSPLVRVAMFAAVIAVFMGASRSALAFIYDSQKGNKRGERGWSLWLPLSAIVRPCLAHPLLRAGIPSLITGHPPRCRSNAVIKAVWESGAFVQLECSAINRLRPKVINCVTKEATATTGEDGQEKLLLAGRIGFICEAFPPRVVCPPRICSAAELRIRLCHHRAALLGPMSWPWIFRTPNSPQMHAGNSCWHTLDVWMCNGKRFCDQYYRHFACKSCDKIRHVLVSTFLSDAHWSVW